MKSLIIPFPQSPHPSIPITLQSVSLSFLQGDVGDLEELSIELTDGGAGYFGHIQTEGWSLDPNEDWITKLIAQGCKSLDSQGKDEDE
jgi:hypothetical protein